MILPYDLKPKAYPPSTERIAHRGKCLSADPCKPECQPTDDEPVCDSAAVTHANICTLVGSPFEGTLPGNRFQKINCERMGRGEQPRSIAHIGKCDSVAMQTDAYVSEDADRSELRDDEEGNHSAEIREVAQTSMVDREQTKAAGDVLFVLTDSLTSSEQQSPNFSQSMPTTDAVLPVAQLSNSSEIRDMGNSETTSSASVTLPLRSMNAFGTSYYPLYRQTAKPESNQDTVNYVRTGLSANNSSITGVNKVRLPSEGILAKENRMYDATAFHKNTVLPPLLHGSGVVNSLDSDEIKTTSMQKTNAQLTTTASSIAVYQTVDDYRTQNNKSDRFGPLSQQPTINTHSAWSIDGALIKNRSEFVALLSTTEKSKIYRTDASDLNVASFYSFTKRIISSSEEERKHDVNETTALPWKALDENVRNLKLEQESVETVSDSDLLIPKTVDGSDEDYSFSTDAASKLFTPSDGERLMRTTSAIAEAVEPLRNNNADKNNWDIPLKIVLSKSDDRAEEKTHRFEELAETPAKPSPIMTEVSVTSENTVNAENTTDEFLNIDRDSGDYAVPFVLEDDSSFEELKVNVSRLNDSVPNETEDQLSTVSSNFDKRNLAGEGEMAAQQTTNTMKAIKSEMLRVALESSLAFSRWGLIRELLYQSFICSYSYDSSPIEVGKRGDLKTQLEAPNAGNYSNWRDVADEVYPSEQSRFATINKAGYGVRKTEVHLTRSGEAATY
ncbi:unnamed protein product [Toxocara canis]|uniref:Kazal-like domain-containing protein n=1 Tax=Toxocara canis TaxID=6265 RepID=A0A183UQX1_TOXCA|nr:unnamed protein product [Toxocara canis]